MPFMAAAVPIAKFAAPLIMKGLGKFFGNKGKQKALKEQQRAEGEQIDRQFKSDTDAFDNREDDRLARMQGVANQLTGARALSPQVIAAALQRRRNTAVKGSVVDKTKGMGTAMVGDALGGVGDLIGKMNSESARAGVRGGGSDMLTKAAMMPSVGGLDLGGEEPCPPGARC